MSKQILFCVESNKRAGTDYKYITETLRHFYISDCKIICRPIFLDSKTKYNAKDKTREINSKITGFKGITNVIYFIDTDDIDFNYETSCLYKNIESYCVSKDYQLVFFSRDIEDVFLCRQISDSEKVTAVENFARKNLIKKVPESNLTSNIIKRHHSNILTILDKFFTRKKGTTK